MKKVLIVLLLSGCWSWKLSRKEVLQQEHAKCDAYCSINNYKEHELYNCKFDEEHCSCFCRDKN